jgi:hypothetical protein
MNPGLPNGISIPDLLLSTYMKVLLALIYKLLFS